MKDAVRSDVAQKAASGSQSFKTDVSKGVWTVMTTEKNSRGKMVSSKECGTDSPSKRVGQSICWRKQQKRCSWKQTAFSKEEREVLRMGDDLRLEGALMRQAF